MNQKWLIVLILVLLGGMLLFVFLARPPARPAVTILPPAPLVVKNGRVLDRWIPAKWTWLRRACRSILGDPRVVGYNIQFIEASETVASIVAKNSLGQPQAECNGLAVWILPGKALQRLNGKADFGGNSWVRTTDQREARQFVGNMGDMRSADLFVGLKKGTCDLSIRLIFCSGLRTNFDAAVRAQLPYDKALVLLDVRQPAAASNRMVCLIKADEPDAKGNRVRDTAGGR
jgi:hypothetical protein